MKGLFWISQFVTENGFITAKEAYENFDMNFLDYECLKRVIKKSSTPIGSINQDLSFYETCIMRKDLAHFAYQHLRTQINFINKTNKWELEMNTPLDDTQFKKEFGNIYSCTNVQKYRSFQYRLLHRAVITNVHLCKWRRISNNLCSLCNVAKESYSHLFYECTHIRYLWQKVEEFLLEYNESQIELNVQNIIFNRIAKPKNNVKNFICLLLKQYVYQCRCKGEPIIFNHFKQHVRKTQNIERYHAIAKNSLIKHNRKWGICE